MPVPLKISVCIVAALALSGCGRRGPLEPPPGAPPQPQPSQATPANTPPGAPGGLFRNTTSRTEESETKSGKPLRRPSPFILDPLL
ncbi:MAG: LPS translocon maturation chaperone LptM [Rhodoblastus sp.]